MSISSLRRRAFTLIELLVVVAIIAVLIALLVPGVQKVRFVAARTQTTNNLKQCALASHAYHDAWKYLPFNGTANATSSDNASGSWAYQILPFLEQQAIYDSPSANTMMSDPVPPLLCAIRARPGYYLGSNTGAVTGTIGMRVTVGGPIVSITTFTANPSFTYSWPAGTVPTYVVENVSGPATVVYQGLSGGSLSYSLSNSPSGQLASITTGAGLPAGSFIITSTTPGGASGGPATDFAINVFINDLNGGINSANVNRQLTTISDGASNTILLGHAYVQTSVYSSTTTVPPSLQDVFVAGSLATGRNTHGDTATDWLKDGTTVTSNQWGSPMPEGGLMAMCDGAVRIFPYATPLTNFLLPDDGNPVELP